MTSRPHPVGRSLVCLALALAPGPALAGPPALFQPSEGDQAKAKVAYEKGSSDYRVGNFEAAASAFEEAYQLSALPDILYNIGLAHLRWYDVDLDPGHLRKAKVVFQNYIIELQNNPELGDLDQVEGLLDQIDEKLAAHPTGPADPEDGEQPVDRGPDPGKQKRMGGAIGMGIGGVFVVGAVASVVGFSLSGQSAVNGIIEADDGANAAGCTAGSAQAECVAFDERITELQAKGQTANTLAIGLGASLGGVGVVGIIVGVVLFVQGNKKTKAWEQARLQVTPSWVAGGGGLSVSGRF